MANIRYRKNPNSIIPDGDPDPEMAAMVKKTLNWIERDPPEREHMADKLPDGVSEAPMPEPPQVIKLPEPTVFHQNQSLDTTTPAFGPITRVNEADLKQIPWIIARLREHFPKVAPYSWYGRLRGYIHDNGYLFVRNERAIALAFVARDQFDERPWVQPVFIIHADRSKANSEDEGGASDAVHLIREIVRWGKTLGASEVRNIQAHCDVPPGRIRHHVQGETRSEVFLRLP